MGNFPRVARKPPSRSKRGSNVLPRRMATLAPAATEPVTSDYVRVRRQMTTTFLWVDPADTAADLKAKIHKITKVPAGDIKLFIDKTGDVVLDETKSLADQKVDNDQELFMVYRKEGGEGEWEEIQIGAPAAVEGVAS